ncbi:ATP-grasp domain-containing protein [Bacillus sp. FJAT-29937]|uniref:ATP-grasp domain-containing protein n=1 Tax=Bacillus sp. FJAT-29937 TaxID=1720553 RepID=UPI00082E9408
MKTILFIGTNKSGSSRDAIAAAKSLGYFTVVFTKNEKQMQQREEYTDVHKMIFIDTDNLSEMKEEIKRLRSEGMEFKLIVSFIDSYVYTASLLCDEFCKNYFSSTAIQKMNSKEETRSLLTNQSYTPKFIIIKPGEEIPSKLILSWLSFPIMVKSPNSTGSKDALLAENEEKLKKYTLMLREREPNESIIIEEYIDGDQYLVEAVVYKSKVMIAGIIGQEVTKGKRFIITGYGVMAKIPDEIEKGIAGVLQSIVNHFGIKNGALHLELRRGKNGWKLIEINPRISGGAMNKMLQAAFGYSLVKETLLLQLGGSPSLVPKHKKFVYTQYLIVSEKGILERVSGKGRARKSPGVVDVYVKPRKGTLLLPPLSMGHRYAYVIAAGESMEEAKSYAKNAVNEIKFHLKKE